MANIKTLFREAGGYSAVARAIGMNISTVSYWALRDRVPAKHVIPVERATGISRHDLRADLYPREDVAA